MAAMGFTHTSQQRSEEGTLAFQNHKEQHISATFLLKAELAGRR
jgi:hypothetical protein